MSPAEAVTLGLQLLDLVLERVDESQRDIARARLRMAIDDEATRLREEAQAALDAR